MPLQIDGDAMPLNPLEMWAQAGNVVVSIALLIIYAYWFGQPSLQKYLDNGVIVIKWEERTSNIPPPCKFTDISNYYIKVYIKMYLLVIVLYRLSTHSAGWKEEKNDALCNSKGDQFIKCIENNSYYNYGHDIDQSKFVSAKYFMTFNILRGSTPTPRCHLVSNTNCWGAETDLSEERGI